MSSRSNMDYSCTSKYFLTNQIDKRTTKIHIKMVMILDFVHSMAVVLLLLTFCLLLLQLWESVIVLCFVVRYFMYILVLQSS